MLKTKIDLVDPVKLAEFLALTLCIRGVSISHLKLQKLLYYAQGWGLVFLKAPLFDEEPEAWVNGPVYRSVYNRFKSFPLYEDLKESTSFMKGHDARLQKLTTNLALGKKFTAHIENVIERYGYKSHDALVLMTHREAPWMEARKGFKDFDSCNKPITHKSMKAYFTKVLEAAKAQAAVGA